MVQSYLGFLDFKPSNSSIAFVQDSHIGSNQTLYRRVNIEEKCCTCMYMDHLGIPCQQFIAVLRFFRRDEEVYSAFDLCYQFECFAAGYGGKSIKLPLFEELEKRDYHKPPNTTVLLGRQRERRILSQGENAGRSKRIRCCSKCERPGHNKQTCSE